MILLQGHTVLGRKQFSASSVVLRQRNALTRPCSGDQLGAVSTASPQLFPLPREGLAASAPASERERGNWPAFIFHRVGKSHRQLSAEVARLCPSCGPPLQAWFRTSGMSCSLSCLYDASVIFTLISSCRRAHFLLDSIPKTTTSVRQLLINQHLY